MRIRCPHCKTPLKVSLRLPDTPDVETPVIEAPSDNSGLPKLIKRTFTDKDGAKVTVQEFERIKE
jgi:hypothetical protein